VNIQSQETIPNSVMIKDSATYQKYLFLHFLVFLLVIIQCSLSCSSGSIYEREKAGTVDPARVEETQRSIERYITAFGSRKYFPSFTVGVVIGNELAYHYCYRTTIHRTYSLASVTKIFTALAVMLLVEEGEIDLDDPISDYLTDVEIARSDLGSDRITIRHLLSHSSGLPDVRHYRPPYNSRTGSIDIKVPGQIYPAGRHYRYANQGFMLLGILVERVTGMSYREYIQKKVYDPVGMVDAKTSKNLSGAGGVIVSMQDMSRYASMWLNEGKSVLGKRIIRGGTIRKMLKQQLHIPYARVKRYVGLGWRIRSDRDGVLTFFHIGGANYVSAWLQIFPRHNCAVIYLGNPPEYTPELMGFLTRMQKKLGELATVMVGARRPVHQFNPTLPTKRIIDRYIGIYKSPVTNEIARVYLEDEKLYMTNEKESIQLFPYSSHIFLGGPNMLTYDFVHSPGKREPDGLATYYDFFERINCNK
jgi:CubicO group peptidase (beta-lactamase class C family)